MDSSMIENEIRILQKLIVKTRANATEAEEETTKYGRMIISKRRKMGAYSRQARAQGCRTVSVDVAVYPLQGSASAALRLSASGD